MKFVINKKVASFIIFGIAETLYAQSIQDTAHHSINEFDIAKNYFSDILYAQLAIFSLIVIALISLYFFFNRGVNRSQIETEVKKVIDEFKKVIKEEHEAENKKIMQKLTTDLAKHENQITVLRGLVYRTLGEFWESEKEYSTAFIWWIRAAHSFAATAEEPLARISLGKAKESVEKISYAQLDYDIIGEFQRLFSEIDDKIYKIEKELLDKAIKDTLTKKP